VIKLAPNARLEREGIGEISEKIGEKVERKVAKARVDGYF
jgi:hypothetical protein